MDEGVLCLKWRDHRSTFLRMLSSIRKKGVFCDATLVCEGKFYHAHQLVLSSCSEYFQQMFEVVGTGASGLAGPARTVGPLVVVLTGVSPRDLEALLEYMYAGEATILQGDLARFMKAAEGLKVHGLAEPPPPASASTLRREAGEGTKRPVPQCEDSWETKRKKEKGDNQKVLRGKEAAPDIVSPAQLASVELAPETQRGMERDTATGTPGDLPGPVAPLSPLSCPQIKYEEVQVKDEPQHLEEVEEEKKEEEGKWNHQQQQHHHQQETTVLGEGAETAQVLGFCDPGLTYLAHTSGLGTVADFGHSSHHARNLHPTTGWEAAGTSGNFPQQTTGHLRAATQIPVKEDVKTEVREDEEGKKEEPSSEVEEVDGELFLTPGEQSRMAEWLTISDELGFSHLKEDVLHMVQRILLASGRSAAFPDGLPDQTWYHRFLRRHPDLALRMRNENLLLKSVISRDSLRIWYSSVQEVVAAAGGQELLSDPKRIFSAGVMTFPINMSDGTVFEPRAAHDRTPRRLTQFVSIVTAVSAAGTVVPGAAVFPNGLSVALHSTAWHVDRSLSGTLQPQNFLEYLQAVFVPMLRREGIRTPVVVFLHGRHNALVTPELCGLYREGVVVVRALHPLTIMKNHEPVVVALTDPLARTWSTEVKAWRSETARPSITTQDFLSVVDRVIMKVTDKNVTKQAFRTSGLFPFLLQEEK